MAHNARCETRASPSVSSIDGVIVLDLDFGLKSGFGVRMVDPGTEICSFTSEQNCGGDKLVRNGDVSSEAWLARAQWRALSAHLQEHVFHTIVPPRWGAASANAGECAMTSRLPPRRWPVLPRQKAAPAIAQASTG